MSRAFALSLTAALTLTATAPGQVPAPVTGGSRRVHPGIAEPAPGAFRNGSAPRVQYAEPLPRWNHGEGFAPAGQSDVDSGGWFSADDGRDVTLSDVHAPAGWQPYLWTEPFGPVPPGVPMQRLVGYLRPAGVSLPTAHPLYGAVGAYVDQAAFELFRPQQDYDPAVHDKVVIVLFNWETTAFPRDHLGRSLSWFQIYQGYFSPDGLTRPELARSAQGFRDNTGASTVRRPTGYADLLAAPAPDANYYPIVAYAVPTVARRQTTCNEQRSLQLLTAVELLLQENSARNPVGAQHRLSAQGPGRSVERDVVTVFAGGSNGGHQTHWALMRDPERIHGAFCSVIHPSIQRLLGEHDLGFAFGMLGGSADRGATVDEHDLLDWGQYTWNQNRWIHDLSYLRRFERGDVHRPACFVVGDEDITSTGTDWAQLAAGAGGPAGAGVRASTGLRLWPVGSELAWSVAENTCHGEGSRFENPYGGDPVRHLQRLVHEVIVRAIDNRQRQLDRGEPSPIPPVASEPPGPSLRALDNPHEWALGRVGEAMPVAASTPAGTSTPLRRDDEWFARTQPGAAGTWLGHKEAMLIHDGRVYVAGIEGVVCAFAVDTDDTGVPVRGGQFVKVAHSNDGLLPGADPSLPTVSRTLPRALGHEATGLAVFAGGRSGAELLVATRRHLHRLALDSLRVLQTVELPWACARPHHLKVASVLPGRPEQVVFASVHGGLVFYDAATFAPIYEWPEPGIVDFVVRGQKVAIQSRRGVVAEVHFEPQERQDPALFAPRVHTISRPIPERLLDPDAATNVMTDPPCQGTPHDLALLQADWRIAGQGYVDALVGLWSGDEDGVAVRAYLPPTRAGTSYVVGARPLLGGTGGLRIATCRQPAAASPTGPTGHVDPGDRKGEHLLLLHNDNLSLYDQFGRQLAQKILFLTAGATIYQPAGLQTHSLVVGELVDNNLAGSDGPYDQEVVVASQSGSLMWLHINDLLEVTAQPALQFPMPGVLLPVAASFAAAALPARYSPVRAGSEDGSGDQDGRLPHANQALAATWAIARRAGEEQLHVLDRRGGYWRVPTASDSAVTSYRNGDPSLAAIRGWQDLGNRDASGATQPLVSTRYGSERVAIRAPSGATKIVTKPWCPTDVFHLGYEDAETNTLPDNWRRGSAGSCVFEGFVAHRMGGDVLDVQTANGSAAPRDVYFWSARSDGVGRDTWGNLVEGVRFPSAVGPFDVAGLWASTAHEESSSTASFLPFLPLRSFVTQVPIMNQQALAARQLASGEVVLALGCPGGRVRVLRPQMGTPSAGHALGAESSSEDYGFGGGALAVEVRGDDLLVWFGTVYGPTPLPRAYGGRSSNGRLRDDEVATGSVQRLRWSSAGAGSFDLEAQRRLVPDSAAAGSDRGGYGVVGLCVADLLPEANGPARDELIVTTLAGDVLVLDAETLATRWRSHVPGAAGMHNSIVVADLDGDPAQLPELYVAGSFGLWRFVQS